jgi:hypothetical protein
VTHDDIKRVLGAAYRSAPGGLGAEALVDGLTRALVALRDHKAPIAELDRRAAHFAGWPDAAAAAATTTDDTPLPDTVPATLPTGTNRA